VYVDKTLAPSIHGHGLHVSVRDIRKYLSAGTQITCVMWSSARKHADKGTHAPLKHSSMSLDLKVVVSGHPKPSSAANNPAA